MDKWKRVRKKALDRDDGYCRECLRYGRVRDAERVHHAWPKEDWPEYEFEQWNLVPLCKSCHDAMHERHGRQLTELGRAWQRRCRPPED